MSAIILKHFHGAACRVAPTVTAFPHRSPGFNLVVAGQWQEPADTPTNVQCVRDTLTAIAPNTATWTYMNSPP